MEKKQLMSQQWYYIRHPLTLTNTYTTTKERHFLKQKLIVTILYRARLLRKVSDIKKKPIMYPENFDTIVNVNCINGDNVGNLVWVLCRMEHELQHIDNSLPVTAMCPGWTSFHQMISKSAIPTTNIGFCTLFPAPPTTTDTVYTVAKNFISINNELERKYSVFILLHGNLPDCQINSG